MTREADLLRDRRRHFALPGGSHDRLVRWLAILLPAGIGAVLAVMVIAPLFPHGEISFLLDRNKVATTEERLRVNNATYRGEDSRRRPFSVTAGSAVQKSAQVQKVELGNITAAILLKDGPATLKTAGATFDLDRNTMVVPGSLDFWPGPGPRTLELGPWGRAGVQLCYEIVFSGEVVDRAHRPDYIFNPSNDGWFGAWGPPQHLAQARLRAIEEGLPVLRSTTNGISAVIAADGRVVASLPRPVSGRLDGRVPPAAAPTLFARMGNALPLGWAALLAVAALLALRRRRR